jgi:hypothetical protein
MRTDRQESEHSQVASARLNYFIYLSNFPMKKTFDIVVALILLGLFSSGCTKIYDKWFAGHEPKPSSECRITQIEQGPGPFSARRTGTYYYDEKGKLDSVVFNDDIPGSQFYYWRYDDHDRLTEYEADYSRDNFNFIHKYAWNGGKITQDTFFFNGPGGVEIVLWDLEYDSEGRVVAQTGKHIDTLEYGISVTPGTWEYNSDGNLANGAEYDNSPNCLTLAKVLAFTERNYSKNNVSSSVLGYNSKGLPIAFRPTGSFLEWWYPNKIIYNCPD